MLEFLCNYTFRCIYVKYKSNFLYLARWSIYLWSIIGFSSNKYSFLRKYGYNLWLWFDLMMPSILFGLIILQLANFMMQFSLGTPLGLDIPNDHSLAEYVEYRYRPTGFEAYQYFQPVALYQAFAYSIVFIISVLCLLINRKYKFLAEGTVFYLVLF